MAGNVYQLAEVCAAVGITARQADYWTRSGLVTPSVCDAKGSGRRRLYDDADVAVFRAATSLLGVHSGRNVHQNRLGAARAVAPIVRQAVADGHVEVVLAVTVDGKVSRVGDGDVALILARAYGAVTVVHVPLRATGPEAPGPARTASGSASTAAASAGL